MKKRLQVYISPESDALLREIAKKDKRSLSSTIEVIISYVTEVRRNENHSKRI